MPPGVWHEVYTPVPSVALGGHFVNWTTLHLTRINRKLDNQQWVTNATHPDINFVLAHMLISLCYPPPTLGKAFVLSAISLPNKIYSFV
jgi:hypothetical protein